MTKSLPSVTIVRRIKASPAKSAGIWIAFMGKRQHFDPPLDKGIAPAVAVLRAAGVDTFESCEGGKGRATLLKGTA